MSTLPIGGVLEDTRILGEIAEIDENDPIKAHIVFSPMGSNMSSEAWITQARVEGIRARAICGYEWIPQHDATKKPICTKCTEIYAARHKGDNQ